MNSRQVTATDVQISGDVLRVAFDGLPLLASTSMHDVLLELRRDHEPFRHFLNQYPRGMPHVNSCLLYPPFEANCSGAFVLASQFAYAPLAGTALMAAACVLTAQSKSARSDEPSEVFLQTARGLSRVLVKMADMRAGTATWFTTRPRVLAKQAIVVPQNNKDVSVILVDAGLPYIVVFDDDLGVSLDDLQKLGPAAAQLSAAVSAAMPPSEFSVQEDLRAYLVMVMSRPFESRVRVAWVSDQGQVANSAGGTGGLAVTAALQALGLSAEGATVTVEAPGGAFDCRIGPDGASVLACVRIIASHTFFDAP